MYIRILMILFLYGYIAGQDDDHNLSKLHSEKDVESYTFANSKDETNDDSTYQTSYNNKDDDIRRSDDAKLFKVLTSIQDDSDKFKTKGDLWSEGNVDEELQIPQFFISVNNYTKDKPVTSFKNYNSSEIIQADGTYNMQHYVYPPAMENQYRIQNSNWEQTNYRNDPCISPSVQYQYSQPNTYGRAPYSEFDPYRAQGTYNIQYYVPPYQRVNQYPATDYNVHSFANPCPPPQPPFPPPVERRLMYPHPNPNANYHSPPSVHSYPFPSPPSQTYNYDGVIPPQDRRSFSFPPSKTFTFPHPPGSGIKGYTPTAPPYIPSIKTPSVRIRTPSTRRMKGYTPSPPTINRRKSTPVRIRTTPSRSRTKSYTPSVPSYTPFTRKPNGRIRTPPTRRTKGY